MSKESIVHKILIFYIMVNINCLLKKSSEHSFIEHTVFRNYVCYTLDIFNSKILILIFYIYIT